MNDMCLLSMRGYRGTQHAHMLTVLKEHGALGSEVRSKSDEAVLQSPPVGSIHCVVPCRENSRCCSALLSSSVRRIFSGTGGEHYFLCQWSVQWEVSGLRNCVV